MSRERPSPDAVQIYGWDVASLSARALETLEDRIGPFLEGRQAFHVSTCQRLELVTIGCELQVEADRFYRGDDALLHVARMAAGLDSLVLGEAEILGQVRSALTTAPPALQSMLAPAIGAARTLRRESSFTTHAGHALDVALQFAAVSEKGDLLVLGGGPMGRRVAERADNLGFSTTIAARRPLALPQGIGHVAFGRLASLAPVQVIVSCLGRAAPQLSKADLPGVTGVALDLSTPANLMPDLDVPVISLSMLIRWQLETGQDAERRHALDKRLRELLSQRLNSEGTPLASLREEVERIRQKELVRSLKLHPELPSEKLDAITRSLVNQIFHMPSRRLRGFEDSELATAVADLFSSSEEGRDDDDADPRRAF